MLPLAFPDKVTPDNDFTDEVVLHHDSLVKKYIYSFVGAGNLQMITSKFSYELLNVLFLDPVLCIALFS